MPDEGFEEKTERATSKKREDVRKKGQVAKSRELPSVAILLCSLITLTVCGSYMYSEVQSAMKKAFSLVSCGQIEVSEVMAFTKNMIVLFGFVVAPLFAAIVITAIMANISQVGFMLSSELIKPQLAKLNPVKGIGRLFSKQSIMELFKSLLKLTIVGLVAGLSVKGEVKHLAALGEMELNAVVTYIFVTILKISVKCTLAMIILVVIDYSFQKWDFEKRIRMTKKEVKDELKTTEGDPQVRARIRSIQLHTARKRMMQSVPQADVVITNPTYLAVALKYDSSVMQAPTVVAKGARKIAAKIKELAKEHDIPLIENKELAQGLYSLVEIGQEIPALFYQAVAEVLAYIYKLKGKYHRNVG